MKLHLPRVCLVGLTSGICAAAFAQSDIPIEYLRPLNNSFSFGVRTTGHGVKVKFGSLGTVGAANFDAAPGSSTTASRIYDDGQVFRDSATVRTSETAATTVQVGNGRYRTGGTAAGVNKDGTTFTEVDANGALRTPLTYTGDFLSYVSGQTRDWSYTNASQGTQVPGSIAMHSYSSTSDGASVTGEGSSSSGIEMEVGHTFGRIGNHMEWGFSFSFGLNDINVKSSAAIRATLHTLTDVYSLNGAAAPAAPYTSVNGADSTDFTNVYQSTGLPVYTTDGATPPTVTQLPPSRSGQENTTPLAQEPTSRTETDTPGGATITGRWQIKGAYYIAKVGPSLRYNFTPRIAVSTSAGVALAYISTRYHVDETFTLPGLTSVDRAQTGPGGGPVDRKLKPGYYGNLNAEFWVTPRTGFFGGVTYEKVGAYDQVLVGRTAHIDIGGGLGYRFGITTRF